MSEAPESVKKSADTDDTKSSVHKSVRHRTKEANIDRRLKELTALDFFLLITYSVTHEWIIFDRGSSDRDRIMTSIPTSCICDSSTERYIFFIASFDEYLFIPSARDLGDTALTL